MTMFDEEILRPKSSEFPRNLEKMSVDEVQTYIAELEAEILRAKSDIDHKKASISAAESVFKS